MKAERTAALSVIAQNVLGLETLETRNADSLDFTDQAVWSIRAALEAAYAAGALQQRRVSIPVF
jgi:hypothetical protein